MSDKELNLLETDDDEFVPTHPMNNVNIATEKPAKKVAKKAAPPVSKKPVKKPAKKPAKKPIKEKAPAKAKVEEHPICVATGIRTNSKLGEILLFLGTEGKLGKMVLEKLIIKHLYGDERSTNRIEVLGKQMNKAKYDLRKDTKDGVVSYGLYAKK